MTDWDDSKAPSDNPPPRKAIQEGKATDQGHSRKVLKRTRHSFYLDAEIIQSVDQAYRRIRHEMYPVEIGKSDFLEECIRYALSYPQEIKGNLTRNE